MAIFSRSEMLIGKDGVEKLKKSGVAVFGLGGVGSYVVEGLVRAGVGKIGLFDGDVIDESNINRQLYALHSTIGMDKCEIAKERVLDINPEAEVVAEKIFFDETTKDEIDFTQFDYIVDAIDTVKSKLLIIETAKKNNLGIISCMGTGNKLNPSAFEITDISKTSVCPLARVMRKELKNRGIDNVNVCYSRQEPVNNTVRLNGRNVPGSISFVPSSAGLLIASKVIGDLILPVNT